MNVGVDVMGLCVKHGGLDNFDTENKNAIVELIEFKWSEFGQGQHMIGLIFHTCQMGILMFYINAVYITDSFNIYENPPSAMDHPQSLWAFSLLICLIWPLGYEAVRMHKDGLCTYFQNIDNYTQLFYVMCSVLMTVMHVLTLPQNF